MAMVMLWWSGTIYEMSTRLEMFESILVISFQNFSSSAIYEYVKKGNALTQWKRRTIAVDANSIPKNTIARRRRSNDLVQKKWVQCRQWKARREVVIIGNPVVQHMQKCERQFTSGLDGRIMNDQLGKSRTTEATNLQLKTTFRSAPS